MNTLAPVIHVWYRCMAGMGVPREMIARVISSAILGIDAYPVVVEVDIKTGLPAFSMVGLPETAVKESRDRVKSAIQNCGYRYPSDRITVNLAPADIKKEGSGFDLPIALGILSASGVIRPERLDGYLITGELSLDGTIHPVRGALSMAVTARQKGLKGIVVPQQNAEEAAVVRGIDVIPVTHVPQVVEILNEVTEPVPFTVNIEELFACDEGADVDFNEVKGQQHVKRALEIAAAGGHNLIMVGPPGSGKTMLARRLATILPPMSFEEAIETTKVFSAVGLLPPGKALITSRPFRSPHHTISDVGLIGGGSIPRPGEVSLANNGVLFLDEMLEFGKHALEVLRQPLEDGKVTITRAAVTITYPTRFILVGAMNPCPCGYYTDPSRQCSCSHTQLHRYRSKLSGPLLDRIDIHVEVPAVSYRELAMEDAGESSEVIRRRVHKTRKLQEDRFKRLSIHCNAQMNNRQVKRFCRISDESRGLMQTAIDRLGMSARAYSRILKIARTIADLEGKEEIETAHVSEAIQYRSLDREYM